MKDFIRDNQQTAVAMAFFGFAAILMMAVLVCGYSGMTGIAQLLLKFAGPACAAATAVLICIAMQKPSTDTE